MTQTVLRTNQTFEELTEVQAKEEMMKCAASPLYFIETYVQIYDVQAQGWIPFVLWKEQREALVLIHKKQKTVALKARQLGITWLALGYALWLMIFRPIATVMLFSKRDDEARYLLSEERLRGMYNKLPSWMQAKKILISSAHQFALTNGSSARAFPPNAGDSYTASFVLVDEADLVPDLNKLMSSVKPTIDAGGKLVMVSRVDKSSPLSPFKQTYRGAVKKENDWGHIFLPWYIRPERTVPWYEAIKADIFSRTGAYDELWEQYPATEKEALAPRSLDKRVPWQWVEQCFEKLQPLKILDYDGPQNDNRPSCPGITIYEYPVPGLSYSMGLDPAEGNPTSDDSALTVICNDTRKEVANLVGKFDPSVMASYSNDVGIFYNNAPVMIERNNHGHAVILWMRDNGSIPVMPGWDQPDKFGWLSNSRGKAQLYSDLADACRDELITIRDPSTVEQIASIEGSTLRAPKGQMDDRSDSFALAYEAYLSNKPLFKPFRLKRAW